MARTNPTHTIAPPDLWAFARTLICDICNLFGDPRDIARELGLTAKARALMLTWLRAGEAVLRHLLLIEAAALLPTLPPLRGAGRDAHASTADDQTRRAIAPACVSPDDPDAPESWRVSFRCLLDRRRPRRRGASGTRKAAGVRPPAKPFADFFKDRETTAKLRAGKAAWIAKVNKFSSPARRGSPEQSEGKGDVGIASRTLCRLRRHLPRKRGRKTSALPQPLAERAEALLRVFNAPALYAPRLAFRLRRTAQLAHAMLRIPADIDRAVDRQTATRFHNVALARLRSDDTSSKNPHCDVASRFRARAKPLKSCPWVPWRG